MPNHDCRGIANEFLKRNGSRMEQMKLQKLVYMAHGWNWAVNGEPLVKEPFQAWDGGPVLRKIWNHIRDFGFNSGLLYDPETKKAFSANLSKNERDVVEHVWNKYSDFSGLELSEMTHQPGTPWSLTYFGKGRNSELQNTTILEHFTRLGRAGRDARAG